MNTNHIQRFLDLLVHRSHDEKVYNQYLDDGKYKNLEIYLDHLSSNPPALWLVGEAPGYRGCRETGIPFTSPAILAHCENKFFMENRHRFALEKPTKESTATSIWASIESVLDMPLLWNAFPFHPHKSDSPHSNRALTTMERAEGVIYVRLVYEMFHPPHIIAIGRSAANSIETSLPNVRFHQVRHPSYGGAGAFRVGLEQVLSLMEAKA